MKKLSELKVAEVSLVSRGANRKRYLVTKSELVDDRVAAALKACERILAPHKDLLPADLLSKLSTALGGADTEDKDMADTKKKRASATQSPEPVSEDHKIEAMEKAKKAYCDHLEKLGYKKYPDTTRGASVPTNKAMDDEDDDMDEDDVEKEVAKAAKGVSREDNKVEKKDIEKGELSALPEGVRAQVEKIFKAHEELVQKNTKLESEIAGVKRVAKRAEFVAKAERFDRLGVAKEELADTLMALSESNPDAVAKIEKMLEAANTQVGKGALFAELGSGHGGERNGASWEAIEKAAMSVVEKSGATVSKEQAVDQFLKTAEGKRMYSEYMSAHPVNK